MENGFIESFNGRLRDECLNVNVFFSLADANENCSCGKAIITAFGRMERWTALRRRSSLGNIGKRGLPPFPSNSQWGISQGVPVVEATLRAWLIATALTTVPPRPKDLIKVEGKSWGRRARLAAPGSSAASGHGGSED